MLALRLRSVVVAADAVLAGDIRVIRAVRGVVVPATATGAAGVVRTVTQVTRSIIGTMTQVTRSIIGTMTQVTRSIVGTMTQVPGTIIGAAVSTVIRAAGLGHGSLRLGNHCALLGHHSRLRGLRGVISPADVARRVIGAVPDMTGRVVGALAGVGHTNTDTTQHAGDSRANSQRLDPLARNPVHRLGLSPAVKFARSLR